MADTVFLIKLVADARLCKVLIEHLLQRGQARSGAFAATQMSSA